MDYKENKLKLKERKEIKDFLDNRRNSLELKAKLFFETNDQYELEEISNNFYKNFTLFILGTMYLYEDSLMFQCYNNLTEDEKLSLFFKHFNRLIENDKMAFLNHFNYITKQDLTKTISYHFLAYEQNVLTFLNCYKKYNPKFKILY